MRQHVTDGIIALVFGLTGTFSILFAPLFTWRAWRRRTAASLVLAVLVVITAGVQLWTIAHSPPHLSGQENLTVEAVAWWLGFRLPAALFLPGDWAVRAPRGVLEVLGVLTVATLLVTAFLPGRHRERHERLPDRHWPDYARRIEAGERVEGIRVNPGMTFSHPGRHRK
jgi:hypothetical protein